MAISGSTKLFPIIGSPVTEVVSPPNMNDWFREKEIDARMVPLEIPPAALAEFWMVLRASNTFLGCSITHPHKQAAFQESDQVTERAKRVKAVNTLRRDGGALFGDMTDGRALVEAFRLADVTLDGQSAHVIGAGGGAGRAIADALCDAGIRAIVIEDTNSKRLSETRDMMRENWPDVSILDDEYPADILIDATPNGKSPNAASLFSTEKIRQCVADCDIAGLEGRSDFLRRATEPSKKSVDAAALGLGQVSTQTSFIFAAV